MRAAEEGVTLASWRRGVESNIQCRQGVIRKPSPGLYRGRELGLGSEEEPYLAPGSPFGLRRPVVFPNGELHVGVSLGFST